MLRRIWGKRAAEVGKPNGAVNSAAAQAEAAAVTSHQRVARAQRHTRRRRVRAGTAEQEAECGARNTGPEGASKRVSRSVSRFQRWCVRGDAGRLPLLWPGYLHEIRMLSVGMRPAVGIPDNGCVVNASTAQGGHVMSMVRQLGVHHGLRAVQAKSVGVRETKGDIQRREGVTQRRSSVPGMSWRPLSRQRGRRSGMHPAECRTLPFQCVSASSKFVSSDL